MLKSTAESCYLYNDVWNTATKSVPNRPPLGFQYSQDVVLEGSCLCRQHGISLGLRLHIKDARYIKIKSILKYGVMR